MEAVVEEGVVGDVAAGQAAQDLAVAGGPPLVDALLAGVGHLDGAVLGGAELPGPHGPGRRHDIEVLGGGA